MKLEYDEPLSNVAFNFNFRHYSQAATAAATAAGVLFPVFSTLDVATLAEGIRALDRPIPAHELVGRRYQVYALYSEGGNPWCWENKPLFYCPRPSSGSLAFSSPAVGAQGAPADVVGQCTLTVSKPVLKAPMVLALETKI